MSFSSIFWSFSKSQGFHLFFCSSSFASRRTRPEPKRADMFFMTKVWGYACGWPTAQGIFCADTCPPLGGCRRGASYFFHDDFVFNGIQEPLRGFVLTQKVNKKVKAGIPWCYQTSNLLNDSQLTAYGRLKHRIILYGASSVCLRSRNAKPLKSLYQFTVIVIRQ